jgi:hypothetical protein
MKKLSTALLAAGLTLSASACVAHPQLSTPETCERIASVVASRPVGKTGMVNVANQVRTIEPVSSSDLKSTVQNLLDYADQTALLDATDESAKAKQDSEKVSKFLVDFQQGYAEFCPTGQSQ